MRIRPILVVAALAPLLAALPAAAQNCGWSRVDHLVSYDASGVWNPNVYRGIVGALTIAQVGGALWEGSESRFGKTMWQGIDSEIIGERRRGSGEVHLHARPAEPAATIPVSGSRAAPTTASRAARPRCRRRW